MGRLEKLAHRMALKKGGMPCPSCGEAQMSLLGSKVVTCQKCGYRASRTEWSMRSFNSDEEEHANPDAPPADTKIVRKVLGPGTIAWEIPPSGKSGGLLFFAIVWTGFIAFWTVAAIIGTAKDGNDSWLFPLFSIPFWAVGIGMLYAALRAKYAFHLLLIGPKTVVLARSFFKRTSRKSLRRDTLKSAEKKEFYQRNYTPVYGVQLKGDDGKIRFGTTLEEDEKSWLVADLQRVLWPERSEDNKVAPLAVTPMVTSPSSTQKLKPFSVEFPPANAKGSMGGTLIGGLVIGTFLVVGIFFLKDAGFFRWVWLSFNSLFALGLISFALASWRNRNRVIRVWGDRLGIHVETRRGRVPVKSETMTNKSGVTVHSFKSGSNNNTAMLRIELVGEDEVLPILKWYPADAAREPLAQLAAALGQQNSPTQATP